MDVKNMNREKLMKRFCLKSIVIIVILAALCIHYQNTRVTVVEFKDALVTLWKTEDGFHDKGYIISEGIYEDHREVVIREKDSFTMTILTYDLNGNLIDAEVYTPSTESEENKEIGE